MTVRAPADPAGAPRVPVDLVRLADVEDPPAGEPGEGQALRRGQPGQQGARMPAPRRTGRQFDDAPAAGLADQQVALGVQASIRAPGTRAQTRPSTRPAPSAPRHGERPAALARRDNQINPRLSRHRRGGRVAGTAAGAAEVAGVAGTAPGRAGPSHAAVTNPAHTTSARQPERIRPVHHPRTAKSHRNGEAGGNSRAGRVQRRVPGPAGGARVCGLGG